MSLCSDKCLRCGQCCHYEQDGKIIPCRFLMGICSIYPNRIGMSVSANSHCDFRSNTEFDYEDCPYNTYKPVKSWKDLTNQQKV